MTDLRYRLYGREGGSPAIFCGGTPSSRWKWPELASAMQRSGLRVLVYDRPGYGGSPRRIGRTVADAADDVRDLADDQGWDRFAMFGGSGGGPHALAAAARLGDRVTRCAVLSGVRPARNDVSEVDLRLQLAGVSAEIMARVEAGGPEIPGDGPPARDDPDAMARLRATFVDSMDGWVDDGLALGRPWGFEPGAIRVPVGVWFGPADADHARWLLDHIPAAQGHPYAGGHLPAIEIYDEIYDWLVADGQVAHEG